MHLTVHSWTAMNVCECVCVLIHHKWCQIKSYLPCIFVERGLQKMFVCACGWPTMNWSSDCILYQIWWSHKLISIGWSVYFVLNVQRNNALSFVLNIQTYTKRSWLHSGLTDRVKRRKKLHLKWLRKIYTCFSHLVDQNEWHHRQKK